MDMSSINWLAVLVAGLFAFVLGGIWYSPMLFGNAWMKENNMTVDDEKRGNKGKIFGWSIIIELIMSANLAMFLAGPKTDIVWGVTAGFLAGLWVLGGIAITGLFEHKSARYIFINGVYQLLSLALMGAIIGLWR